MGFMLGKRGLGGEIRPVYRIENRINEAEKLGFKEVFISYHNLKPQEISQFNIKIRTASKLSDALRMVF